MVCALNYVELNSEGCATGISGWFWMFSTASDGLGISESFKAHYAIYYFVDLCGIQILSTKLWRPLGSILSSANGETLDKRTKSIDKIIWLNLYRFWDCPMVQWLGLDPVGGAAKMESESGISIGPRGQTEGLSKYKQIKIIPTHSMKIWTRFQVQTNKKDPDLLIRHRGKAPCRELKSSNNYDFVFLGNHTPQ